MTPFPRGPFSKEWPAFEFPIRVVSTRKVPDFPLGVQPDFYWIELLSEVELFCALFSRDQHLVEIRH